MIIEYLVHVAVHLAIDFVANAPSAPAGRSSPGLMRYVDDNLEKKLQLPKVRNA